MRDAQGSTTFCPGCQAPLIERDGYAIGRYAIDVEGACSHCATPIAGRFDKAPDGHAIGNRRRPVRLHVA